MKKILVIILLLFCVPGISRGESQYQKIEKISTDITTKEERIAENEETIALLQEASEAIIQQSEAIQILSNDLEEEKKTNIHRYIWGGLGGIGLIELAVFLLVL